MNFLTILLFAALIAAVIVLWRQGQLTRLADYVRETREELKKCTWPTWNELKGSTLVVIVSIGLLGLFTMAADGVFYNVLKFLTLTTS